MVIIFFLNYAECSNIIVRFFGSFFGYWSLTLLLFFKASVFFSVMVYCAVIIIFNLAFVALLESSQLHGSWFRPMRYIGFARSAGVNGISWSVVLSSLGASSPPSILSIVDFDCHRDIIYQVFRSFRFEQFFLNVPF